MKLFNIRVVDPMDYYYWDEQNVTSARIDELISEGYIVWISGHRFE